MSDKRKTFALPAVKTKRPTTVAATQCRNNSSNKKDKVVPTTSKNLNMTVIGEHDVSIMKPKSASPNFDGEYRQIAYGKFLRAMLEECLLDEKIEREETQMDIQMALLAERFKCTVDHLDKTSRRLKEINFVVEQKRLLDLKRRDCDEFYEKTQQSSAAELLEDLQHTELACLDKLQTRNVDFGYDSNSGHKQLLDAVNDAIDGLEQIKKHSNLDPEKFKEYEKMHSGLQDLEKERFGLENIKSEFENKFPEFSEKLLKEASERISKMINDDDDDDEN